MPQRCSQHNRRPTPRCGSQQGRRFPTEAERPPAGALGAFAIARWRRDAQEGSEHCHIEVPASPPRHRSLRTTRPGARAPVQYHRKHVDHLDVATKYQIEALAAAASHLCSPPPGAEGRTTRTLSGVSSCSTRAPSSHSGSSPLQQGSTRSSEACQNATEDPPAAPGEQPGSDGVESEDPPAAPADQPGSDGVESEDPPVAPEHQPGSHGADTQAQQMSSFAPSPRVPVPPPGKRRGAGSLPPTNPSEACHHGTEDPPAAPGNRQESSGAEIEAQQPPLGNRSCAGSLPSRQGPPSPANRAGPLPPTDPVTAHSGAGPLPASRVTHPANPSPQKGAGALPGPQCAAPVGVTSSGPVPGEAQAEQCPAGCPQEATALRDAQAPTTPCPRISDLLVAAEEAPRCSFPLVADLLAAAEQVAQEPCLVPQPPCIVRPPATRHLGHRAVRPGLGALLLLDPATPSAASSAHAPTRAQSAAPSSDTGLRSQEEPVVATHSVHSPKTSREGSKLRTCVAAVEAGPQADVETAAVHSWRRGEERMRPHQRTQHASPRVEQHIPPSRCEPCSPSQLRPVGIAAAEEHCELAERRDGERAEVRCQQRRPELELQQPEVAESKEGAASGLSSAGECRGAEQQEQQQQQEQQLEQQQHSKLPDHRQCGITEVLHKQSPMPNRTRSRREGVTLQPCDLPDSDGFASQSGLVGLAAAASPVTELPCLSEACAPPVAEAAPTSTVSSCEDVEREVLLAQEQQCAGWIEFMACLKAEEVVVKDDPGDFCLADVGRIEQYPPAATTCLSDHTFADLPPQQPQWAKSGSSIQLSLPDNVPGDTIGASLGLIEQYPPAAATCLSQGSSTGLPPQHPPGAWLLANTESSSQRSLPGDCTGDLRDITQGRIEQYPPAAMTSVSQHSSTDLPPEPPPGTLLLANTESSSQRSLPGDCPGNPRGVALGRIEQYPPAAMTCVSQHSSTDFPPQPPAGALLLANTESSSQRSLPGDCPGHLGGVAIGRIEQYPPAAMTCVSQHSSTDLPCQPPPGALLLANTESSSQHSLPGDCPGDLRGVEYPPAAMTCVSQHSSTHLPQSPPGALLLLANAESSRQHSLPGDDPGDFSGIILGPIEQYPPAATTCLSHHSSSDLPPQQSLGALPLAKPGSSIQRSLPEDDPGDFCGVALGPEAWSPAASCVDEVPLSEAGLAKELQTLMTNKALHAVPKVNLHTQQQRSSPPPSCIDSARSCQWPDMGRCLAETPVTGGTTIVSLGDEAVPDLTQEMEALRLSAMAQASLSGPQTVVQHEDLEEEERSKCSYPPLHDLDCLCSSSRTSGALSSKPTAELTHSHPWQMAAAETTSEIASSASLAGSQPTVPAPLLIVKEGQCEVPLSPEVPPSSASGHWFTEDWDEAMSRGATEVLHLSNSSPRSREGSHTEDGCGIRTQPSAAGVHANLQEEVTPQAPMAAPDLPSSALMEDAEDAAAGLEDSIEAPSTAASSPTQKQHEKNQDLACPDANRVKQIIPTDSSLLGRGYRRKIAPGEVLELLSTPASSSCLSEELGYSDPELVG